MMPIDLRFTAAVFGFAPSDPVGKDETMDTPGTQAKARLERGRALRDTTPRSSHAVWTPKGSRDPLALLELASKGRLQDLVPLRNTRMVESAFTFFRGSAIVMAADLADSPVTGLRVQACGDAHCLNFGGFATPERNLIFDVNDFDETLPGPWEWDLKRLVTSMVLAGRSLGLKKRESMSAAVTAAQAYRMRMRELAFMPALDVFYQKLDATKILDAARSAGVRRRRGRIADDAATTSVRAAVEKFTDIVDGERRFIDDPPILFHSSKTEQHGFEVEEIIAQYAQTLAPDVRVLFDRYRLIDHAIKVVGVGSVGTRCAVALFSADDDDSMILQIKEARPSVLEPYVGKSAYGNQGERVVRGQRLMQSASDALLGWASSGEHDFYVRQFKDMKASANFADADIYQLREYARYCAVALAGAHARSGEDDAIAGYIGKSDVFDRAIVEFAMTYADQAEADHAQFVAAIATGEVEAA